MAGLFDHELVWSAADATPDVPAQCGILALFGAGGDRPYLAKTANLKRRLARLLAPAEGATQRRSLRDRVTKIAWRVTGSDFESNLLLYRAYSEFFDRDEARNRLKLRTPFCVRFTNENRFPRMYVTNRMNRRALRHTFGPFASRAAAEEYVHGVNELFHLRRCHEELEPFAEHPGCVYGEMKKCSAPCQARVGDEAYRVESDAVLAFLETHGEAKLAEIAAERERSSVEMEFERAAELHTRYTEVKFAADAMGGLVQPIETLRAVLLLPVASEEPAADVWLVRGGCLSGPQRFSTLGVRLAKEQAQVGSSLFAQPLMLEAVPEEGVQAATESPEARLLAILTEMESGAVPENVQERSDGLALLKRWYYRPETKRVGAICFTEKGSWPVRKMVRSAAKVASSV